MKHLLAIDVGSSYLKCALYTADLQLVAHVAEPIVLHIAGPQVENDPEDWWSAMRRGIPALLREAGIATNEVGALSFCAQMQSVVLVDRELNAVRRSIGYLDTRATDLFAQHMQRGWPRVAGANAVNVAASAWHTNIAPASPKDALWKVRWLQVHEPGAYARAHRWLDVKDYLVARATGRAVATADTAHLTCLYEFQGEASQYNRGLCRRYGIDPRLLPEVVAGNRVIAGLLPGAARELGLAAGTAVVPGGGDISCVALGTGATAEGDTHIYVGTSAWVAQSTRKQRLDVANYMATVRSCLPNAHLYLGELETAGVCLAWAAKLLAGEGEAHREPGELEAEAVRSPPGARGLLFLPWLHGSRSPNEDAFARGGFVNLGLEHRRCDLIRAVFEGVALHLGWILEALDAKLPISGALRFVGGGANSALWAQSLADVTGKTIETVASPQLCGARGAALLAAAALSPETELRELSRDIRAARVFVPIAANHALSRTRLATMKAYYVTNRPLFRTLSPA